MKKPLIALSTFGMLSLASPAFAHHGEETTLLANIAHWLTAPLHAAISLTAFVFCVAAVFTLIRKNSKA